mmetsp:Transcript_74/g.165  ORF Transcript_74/g.165 Transcript_74/m.165 type:complete len:138 (+) Transcript_74:93-506(+)
MNKSMPSPTLQSFTQPWMTDSLTKEQYRHLDRQRNFQLCVSLLVEHASRCESPACLSSNCQKMKFYLKHGLACTAKASGGCLLCKRTTSLLRTHAQQCKIDNTTMHDPEHPPPSGAHPSFKAQEVYLRGNMIYPFVI